MAPDDDEIGADLPSAIGEDASGTNVWAVSGASSSNKHVKMALSDGYPYGTRVK
jgi:hypothetical protein